MLRSQPRSAPIEGKINLTGPKMVAMLRRRHWRAAHGIVNSVVRRSLRVWSIKSTTGSHGPRDDGDDAAEDEFKARTVR